MGVTLCLPPVLGRLRSGINKTHHRAKTFAMNQSLALLIMI